MIHSVFLFLSLYEYHLFVCFSFFYNQFVKVCRSMFVERQLQSRWRRRLFSTQLFCLTKSFLLFFYFCFHSNRTSIRSRIAERNYQHRQLNRNYQFSIKSRIRHSQSWYQSRINRARYQNNFHNRIQLIFYRVSFESWLVCSCRTTFSHRHCSISTNSNLFQFLVDHK